MERNQEFNRVLSLHSSGILPAKDELRFVRIPKIAKKVFNV